MISSTGVLAGLSLLTSTASAAAGVGAVPKLPDTVKNSTSSSNRHGLMEGFVTREGGKLFLNGQSYNFRTFNAPNLIHSTSDFENEDTFAVIAGLGSAATRTYILASIENDQFGGNVGSDQMIQSWNDTTDDWNYNEEYLVYVDKMLAQAASFGVKIIIPFVNQDYGSANDWFGTITDLIRHRYNISDYDQANLKVDFFTDPEMLRVFKKIITKALTRKNTVNGRIWGHDDTVLAWETGNEMNHGVYTLNTTTNKTTATYTRPAPGDWTVPVAQHIKSLAPDTLVMDGSFSRICDSTTGACQSWDNAWPQEALESEYVDIFSYHYYGDGDIKLFKPAAEQVAKYNKAFVIGEHGFYSQPGVFNQAWGNMSALPVAGGAIWSMRPHADSSGFLTHSEGGGVYSYHFPGWNRSPAPDFQRGEHHIVHKTFIHSYTAIDKSVPPWPIPGVPLLKDASNATFGPGVTWRGTAWGAKYELWAAAVAAPFFQLVGADLVDCVDEGALFIPVEPSNALLNISYNAPKSSLSPQPKEIHWKDTKWDGSAVDTSPDAFSRRLRRSEVVSPEMERMMKKRASKNGEITIAGSWYVVRALSAGQHIPGPFSNPVFVAAPDNSTSSS